jgi:GTP-binding protein YchF
MKVAIIGLPNSGKTTVFNALTKSCAETATFSLGRLEPNLATVKVPDSRLEKLNEIYRPKKLTSAEVQYVDIGGLGGTDLREDGLAPELLNSAGTADALLHVVRAFNDERVPHPSGSVDVARDVAAVDAELMLADLLLIERRLERLEKDIRKFAGSVRAKNLREQQLLLQIKEELESERPIRDLSFTSEEEKFIRGFQLLSRKPVLLLLNIDESSIKGSPPFDYPFRQSAVVELSAKVEAELAQLEDNDAEEFMADLGISEAARDRVIRMSYQLLGLISFLTVGEDEVRAWTIRCGMTAHEAGGVIHSDIQRGFIRAEVIPYENLVTEGSIGSAKKRGLVRLEGKDYIVKDGDISHFLFNV